MVPRSRRDQPSVSLLVSLQVKRLPLGEQTKAMMNQNSNNRPLASNYLDYQFESQTSRRWVNMQYENLAAKFINLSGTKQFLLSSVRL